MTKFDKAIEIIDSYNNQDPTLTIIDEKSFPNEFLYSVRLTNWVKKLDSTPSEELLIAARSQHICRWKIPRSTFETNRKGYLQWRSQLAKFHAEKTGEILTEIGYDKLFIEKVQNLNRKTLLKKGDKDAQTLEDALCLVFLEFQLNDFIKKYAYEKEKISIIIQKTWKKMSKKGQQEAMKLKYNDKIHRLIEKALQ